MGASPNRMCGIHEGYIQLCLGHGPYTDGDGNHHPARHIGCTLGRSGLHPDASEMEALQTAGVFSAIIGGAVRVLMGAPASELDDCFAALTAPADPDSPWPGVKPCDFWGSLTASERAAMAAKIRHAAITAQFSA